MSETESSGARGWPRSTAIIGAGTMGLGVAESFAVDGTAVRLTDATPESTHEAYERLMQRIQRPLRPPMTSLRPYEAPTSCSRRCRRIST